MTDDETTLDHPTLVTLFAVVVMLCGPVLTAWLGHIERKRLFVAVLVLFAAPNALAAMAPNLWTLAIARILPALALALPWPCPCSGEPPARPPGNWLGGLWVDRKPLATTAAFSALLALGMVMTVLFARLPVGLVIALAVWGVANTALYPICQLRVMKSAPQAQALAGTINVSAANGGIALGALMGGTSIPLWGVGSMGFVDAGVALLAAIAVPFVARLARAEGRRAKVVAA